MEILIKPKTDIGAVVEGFADGRYYPAAEAKRPGDVVLNFGDGRYYLITAKDVGELTGLLLRASQGGWLVPTESAATFPDRAGVVVLRGKYPFLIGG